MQYRLWLILAVLLDLSWNVIAILGKKLLVRTLLYLDREKNRITLANQEQRALGYKPAFVQLYIFQLDQGLKLEV